MHYAWLMSMKCILTLINTVGDESDMQSMSWLDEMNDTLEKEGFQGPYWYIEMRLEKGVRSGWLFNNALRYSGLMYLKHCIDPFTDTEKWNLELGPRLVMNLTEGGLRTNNLQRFQSAFFLLSLGSISGETVAHGSGAGVPKGESLCLTVFFVLAENLWWAKDQPFCQLARQFIDDMLRRTDMQKLKPSSYQRLVRFCRKLQKEREVSSAGLVSFLGDVDRSEPEPEAKEKSKYQRDRRGNEEAELRLWSVE
jgi:hypothetical protein